MNQLPNTRYGWWRTEDSNNSIASYISVLKSKIKRGHAIEAWGCCEVQGFKFVGFFGFVQLEDLSSFHFVFYFERLEI